MPTQENEALRILEWENECLRKKVDDLQASNQRIMSHPILQAIPDMVFVMDLEGMCVDYRGNGRVVAKQVVGYNVKDSGLAEETVEAILKMNRLAVETERVQELTYRIPFADGERFFESRSVRLDANTVLRVVRDVTDKARMSAQLTQYIEILESFAYDISHHLRLPVANIMGLAKILSIDHEHLHLQDEISDRISHCAADLDKVVRNLNEKLSATINGRHHGGGE